MRIAMVSTRFAGLDGVSLETEKVARALERSGHEIRWLAGELGPTFVPGTEIPGAHFSDPVNLALERAAFGDGDPAAVRATIAERAEVLAGSLGAALDEHAVDCVIVQNAWAIPMQLPLAVAVDRVLGERHLPAIGHHHDFWWERERFSRCVVPEILETVFPPTRDDVAHIVINADAADDLHARRGVRSAVLPNVMDFEHPPVPGDGAGFRGRAGVEPGSRLLLQPTRVIPRKGIELTIELAARVAEPATVVVTHPDDLDAEYWSRLEAHASQLGVPLRLVDAGRSATDLADAYAAADVVCFPSWYEGYGNALVETFYYRRPVVVNRYSVYVRDIAPLGFDCVELDGKVDDGAVQRVDAILADASTAADAVHANYRLGLEHLSYEVAERVFAESLASVG
jgi:glycosyltransferase involved in cell wall biosynthesis